MRIIDLLKKDSIELDASPKTKSEAIDLLVELQVKGGNIIDREEYKKVFWLERKRVLLLLERELPYHMQKVKQ